MKLDLYCTPSTTISSKQIKERSKTIKLLEEHREEELHDLGFSNEFLVMTLKTSCVSKNTINKVKKQLTGWEKLFANYVSGKGLIFRICEEHLQLNNKITGFKNAKDLNIHFFKEDTQKASKHIKRYSTSLTIKVMQIKPQ